jgi:Na+(H+)/acetate symporter ActP
MPIVAATMPAVAAVTLVGVALLVVVLAGYLIRVALILQHVVGRLNSILASVVAVTEESAPIGQVANAINADLEAGHRSLERALASDAQGSDGQESASSLSA